MRAPPWWPQGQGSLLFGRSALWQKLQQAGQWGFIEYRPPNKKPEYRPNIDHTALYRPNIDRKISLKNEYYRN